MHAELTPQDYMCMLGGELTHQDNRATSQPMYVVFDQPDADNPRFRTACLTKAAADRYINQNQHNMDRPYIFVESGHKNEQWCILRELALATYRRLNEPDNGG